MEIPDDIQVEIERLRQEAAEAEAARAAAEQKLSDLHSILDKYQLIANQSGEAILIIRDGKCIFSTPSAQRIYGESLEGLTIDQMSALVHPDDRLLVSQHHDRLLAGEEIQGDFICRVVDIAGGLHWIAIRPVSVEWDGHPALLEFCREFSEWKRIEGAIDEREELFSAMVDRSDDGVAIIQRGKLVYANQRLAKILGYPHDEVVGSDFARFLHPEYLDLVIDRYTRRMAGEEVPSLYEAAILTKDGRKVETEVNAGVVNYRGQPADFVYVRDISDRKRSEESLRASEEHFRSIVQQMTDLVFVLDVESQVLYETPSVSRVLGYPPGSLIGKNSLDLVHPDDRPRVFHDLVDVIQKRNTFEPTEFRVRSASGNWVQIEAIGNNLLDYPAVQGIVITGREISARKLAQEELRSLKEFNEQIVQSMVEGILIQDQDGYYRFANPAVAKILGYEPHEIEGKHWRDLIPADQHAIVAAAIERRQKGESDSYDLQFLRKDGSRITAWISGNPLFNQNGYAGAVAVFDDITERKSSEARIRRLLDQQITVNRLALALGNLTELGDIYQTTHEVVQTLMDADAFVISLLDPQKRLLRAGYASVHNSAIDTAQIPDFDLRQDIHLVQGRVLASGAPLYLSDYPHSPDRSALVRELHGDLGKEHERLLGLIDAHTRSALAVPMKVGGEMLGVVMVHSRRPDAYRQDDIEMLLALTGMAAIAIQNALLLEQAHQQSEEIQQIINSVPEGVILLDANQHVLLANPVAENLLKGLADAEAPDFLESLGDRRVADLLQPPPRGYWHEVRANGRIYEAIAQSIESGPTPGGWVLVIGDVTQQREVVQRVQQQERMATVGQLAAGIAHDFNNIMSTIVLYSQMSAQSPWVSERDRDRMHTIERQAMHATELIRQILDFSRSAVLERQPLSLRPLVKEQARLFERTLGENIQVELGGMAQRCIVYADPTRIQQVLMNLALNARDAMPDGGVLHISIDQITILAKQKPPLPEMKPGVWVRLSVADTGIGIREVDLPHIFEPFYTTKDLGEGTGLGLAQVYGIVSQHDGFIDVKSHPGAGTEISIYLPALPEDLSGLPAMDTGPLVKGRSETILVVEDSPMTRQALVDSLEMLNYRVIVAGNGREALDILQDQTRGISLILSDVIMPEMSGLALLREIIDRKIGIPVVLLTGHSLGKEIEQLRERGLVELLTKPPTLEQISETVKKMIQARA